MIMVRIVIPDRLPGLNTYTKANRTNKIVGAKMKKEAEQFISWHVKAQCKKSFERVNIKFTWVENDKRRDPDNIMFAQKFIFDSLVACGVLKNDGWKEINSVTHEFEVSKNNAHVIVEISEVKV